MTRFARAAFAAALAAGLAGCAASPGTRPDVEAASATSATAQVSELTLNVFAAASLTDAFESLETKFEAANPAVDVVFNFAGSADLAAQITEGAPADVFASANESQMAAVGDAVAGPEIFASNALTIAVAAGNPLGIAGLGDLANPELRLVVCAPAVPCGAATATLASTQGVALAPVSEESNVTDVLGKVASGEADAGVVYVTDIARADGIEGVAIAGAESVVSSYPIGALTASAHGEAADAFVAWVLGAEGQAVLTSYGFGAP